MVDRKLRFFGRLFLLFPKQMDDARFIIGAFYGKVLKFAQTTGVLRRLFAIVCLLAFAGQTFSQALVVADYYFNTDAYKASCENKSKPQMKCHGKCQMAKKIQQQEKKESQQPSGKYAQKGFSILSSRSFFPVVPTIHIFPTRNYGANALIQLLDMPRFLLRPPDNIHASLI